MLVVDITFRPDNKGNIYSLHYEKGNTDLISNKGKAKIEGFDKMQVFYAMAFVMTKIIDKHRGEIT